MCKSSPLTAETGGSGAIPNSVQALVRLRTERNLFREAAGLTGCLPVHKGAQVGVDVKGGRAVFLTLVIRPRGARAHALQGRWPPAAAAAVPVRGQGLAGGRDERAVRKGNGVDVRGQPFCPIAPANAAKAVFGRNVQPSQIYTVAG